MKASAYHGMSTEELIGQNNDLKTELFNLRFQLATGQLANTQTIKECKRNIARVQTILRERELKAAGSKG